MKNEKSYQSKRRRQPAGGRHASDDPPWITLAALCLVILIIFWSCCASLFVTGCTVTPKVVKPNQASFDIDPATGRQEQNSGLLGHDPYGYAIITLHALDRYNGLIDRYGSRFNPAIHRNEGVFLTSTNTAVMSNASEFYFATMNRWLHAATNK